jgi:hypothetical protein
MRAGVSGGQLMFTLADGTSISCPCVGEPYASQISAEIDRLRTELAAARDALRNDFEPDNQSRAWHRANNALGITSVRPKEAS